MASEHGFVRYVGPKTGELIWIARAGGKFYPSPIAADGKIYLLSENGDTVVLAHGRQPVVLARHSLAEPCIASTAIANGQILSDQTNICFHYYGRGRVLHCRRRNGFCNMVRSSLQTLCGKRGKTPVRIVFVEIKAIEATKEDLNKYKKGENKK